MTLWEAWEKVIASMPVISALGGATWLIVRSAAKKFEKMRTNDLRHIDEKIDSVQATASRVEESVKEQGRTLQRHLEWHIGEPKR